MMEMFKWLESLQLPLMKRKNSFFQVEIKTFFFP